MPLEISYFDGSGSEVATDRAYGLLIGSASVTLTASSASCGPVPNGTVLARVKAGEVCRVSNNGATASAANGIHLGINEVIDIAIRPGVVFNALTA